MNAIINQPGMKFPNKRLLWIKEWMN